LKVLDAVLASRAYLKEGGIKMPTISDPTEIIKSQQKRITEDQFTAPWPIAKLESLVGQLKAKSFVAVEKNEETEWTVYRTPQTLIVMDRIVEPIKGRQVLERVMYFQKDGGKFSVSGTTVAKLGLKP
jgi:hypothetical protein